MDDSSAELDFGADDIPAIVAHDIKNPLQCIQGYAAMLARGTVDQGKVRVMAERILSCGDRIEAITNDLLRQRDADAKALRFDPKPVVLADAVREVVESFGAVCQEKRIKLSWAPASRLEAIVADARRIQQAVANLVGNAVAHVAPDGTIEVSLHDGGDEFVIAVADNGTGVALEQQGRLFEKGYQVRDGRQGSLGLGLHVAKLVAEGHGGRVWMQSGGLGKGATFFLSVPTTAPAAGGSRGRAASWLRSGPERRCAAGCVRGAARPPRRSATWSTTPICRISSACPAAAANATAPTTTLP